MMSSLTTAATASDRGWGAAAGAAAGGGAVGRSARGPRRAWPVALSGAPMAKRAAATAAPRAARAVTFRAWIIGEVIPWKGRVAPTILPAIDWSAQCGEG